MVEKEQLPDFWFLGGVELALGRGTRRAGAEKVPQLSTLVCVHFGGSKVDELC
jgi:hypothetical protein